jgi:hypothetical protein
MAEKTELKPIKQLDTADGLRWSVYSPEQTSLQLVALEDPETGVTVTTPVANTEKRSASYKAWAGARQSRAGGTPWEILNEMGAKGIDPDEKLEEMFTTYGHASVADMARIQVDFITPMHWNMALFNQSPINGGQEKSTRYQSRFGRASLHPIRNYLPYFVEPKLAEKLEEEYQSFGDLSLELFAKTREKLTPVYTDFYQPENKDHVGALNSRVLDSARYFLLLGQGSGMSMETSARDWARIIGEFKASPIPLYRRIAGQVEHLLCPSSEEENALGYLAEAPGLIRHAESAPTVYQNLVHLKAYAEGAGILDEAGGVPIRRDFAGKVEQDLTLFDKDFSAGDLLAGQYLQLIWPGADTGKLLEWVHGNNYSVSKGISAIIFQDHDKFKELPIWTGTTGLTVDMKSFMGELRDFNRHRGMRRFIPMPLAFGLGWDFDTTQQILARGYGLPRYVDEVSAFKDQKTEMMDGMNGYYDKLYKFVDEVKGQFGNDFDYNFVLNLLPLGHQMDLWMSGDPKQWLYFASQRVRPSGHINYRTLAFDANILVSSSDAYLSGMSFYPHSRPDAANRQEFFDRS